MIRVVIVEDHVSYAQALGAVIDLTEDVEVVGATTSASDATSVVARLAPDVAIVDVRMPPTHTDEGIAAAVEARRRLPDLAVLVLSAYVEPAFATDLLTQGSAKLGYLLKERVTRIADLADGVRRVAAGGSVVDPEVVGRLLGRARRHSPLDELTRREREVLGLMAEGRSNLAISGQLSVDPRTVEGHVGTIFAKLGLEPAPEDHRRVLAVLAFLRG